MLSEQYQKMFTIDLFDFRLTEFSIQVFERDMGLINIKNSMITDTYFVCESAHVFQCMSDSIFAHFFDLFCGRWGDRLEVCIE